MIQMMSDTLKSGNVKYVRFFRHKQGNLEEELLYEINNLTFFM